MCEMNKRNFNYDIIRVLACVMVILMHSPRVENGLPAAFHASLALLTMPCIGLFFMVSGALLLPVRTSYVEFVKRRLKKIVGPIIVFSLLYLSIQYADGYINLVELCRGILSVPFGVQGSGVLWFLDVIVGLYLLTPLISPFIEKATKKELQFILILWIVTMCSPWIYTVIGTHTSFFEHFEWLCGGFYSGILS